MVIIGYLFFTVEFQLKYDLTLSQMQNKASKLSTMAINSHMFGKQFRTDDVMFDTGLVFGFYDTSGQKVMGNLEDEVTFLQKSYKRGDDLYLVDTSVAGHLGVSYIIIKEGNFFKIKDELLKEIISIFLLFLIVVGVLGYYLGKLFIKPILQQREKLNDFIKNTTHELNTPVTALLMSAKNPSKDTEKNLERIALSATRVSEIYKDLTYLFLESVEREKSQLPLKTVIEEQLKYFQPLAEKKRVKIIKDLKETTLFIDKESFTRVFNNLLSNAIKYNKNAGKVEIILNERSLLVRDSGIGIEEEKQKEIFNRFYRGTDVTGGFGIGLDIVSKICSENSIELKLQSKEGKGATFSLSW